MSKNSKNILDNQEEADAKKRKRETEKREEIDRERQAAKDRAVAGGAGDAKRELDETSSDQLKQNDISVASLVGSGIAQKGTHLVLRRPKGQKGQNGQRAPDEKQMKLMIIEGAKLAKKEGKSQLGFFKGNKTDGALTQQAQSLIKYDAGLRAQLARIGFGPGQELGELGVMLSVAGLRNAEGTVDKLPWASQRATEREVNNAEKSSMRGDIQSLKLAYRAVGRERDPEIRGELRQAVLQELAMTRQGLHEKKMKTSFLYASTLGPLRNIFVGKATAPGQAPASPVAAAPSGDPQNPPGGGPGAPQGMA